MVKEIEFRMINICKSQFIQNMNSSFESSNEQSQLKDDSDELSSLLNNPVIQSAINNQLQQNWDFKIKPNEDLLNTNDNKIKDDILRVIIQYLSDEGYYAATMTIMDEANMKTFERLEQQAEIKRMKKAILEGDWADVDRLCSRPFMRNHKSFLYAAYEQQYLEYIDHHEIQKAFTHLNKRLKPLEHLQRTPTEFRDLCYLLTAKSVQDVPSFKNWEGIPSSREKLVEMFQNMIDFDIADREGSVFVPPYRLMTLLRQAVAYQIQCSRYHPSVTPKISTLLRDFSALIVPNATKTIFHGHQANVKCAEFLGSEGNFIISGSSDNTCMVWDTETGRHINTLNGHASRIWDLTSKSDGKFAASGSGDSTIKIWNVQNSLNPCVSTLVGHSGDVYSVKYHPGGDHLASGGYDRVVRLYDIEREKILKTFSGHSLSISKAIFSPLGNLIISGSKDSTIKFWDIVSGLCIKTISSHLGEVTSVEISSDGYYLLSSSKDNSNRLWDVRMLRPIRKFKGHQNTSKNFIRSSFAGDSLIVGGSEDGIVYVWDREKGEVLQRLRHHSGLVYSMIWNAKQSLFLSCSEDKTLATWVFDESKPLA
ncbi:WD40-repeat-containing domain protein [Globomyces pollinis-pini]|nr:WD40-repeat-containing domain protein [Globomyces pollinis-pini]